MTTTELINLINTISLRDKKNSIEQGRIMRVNPDNTYNVLITGSSGQLYKISPLNDSTTIYSVGDNVLVGYAFESNAIPNILGKSSLEIPEEEEVVVKEKDAVEYLLGLNSSGYTISKFSLEGTICDNINIANLAEYLTVKHECIYGASEAGVITKYNNSGTILNSFDFEIPSEAIAVHPNSDFKNYIYSIDPSGFLYLFDLSLNTYTFLKNFNSTLYSITSTSSNLYVGYFTNTFDYCISKLDFDGNIEKTITIAFPAWNLTSDIENNIYACSYTDIYIYDSNLNELKNFSSETTFIAVSATGNIYGYVASGGYSPEYYIYVYDENGDYLYNWQITEELGEGLCII
ncbi:MAG: hypothetical protein WC309_03575 [Candidatus Paceibacterota bacterium]|jgi:hypothetical protein